MKQAIYDLASNITTLLSNFIETSFNENRTDYILKIINVYNRYQEDEKDGVDYLFNIDNKEDVITCLKGGMDLNELVKLHKQKNNSSKWFLFGQNHLKPFIVCYSVLKHYLLSYANEIAKCIIAYPWVEEYRALYVEWVTNDLIGD
jgi:hypothetical protein